ncbi:MAG: protease complex subunit PrcB family protein [Clostridia bacterium]|nr:protease complex subunit PrcB family protein [Clostridia bacterium]
MKIRKLIIGSFMMFLIGSMIFTGCAKKIVEEEPIVEEPSNGITVNIVEFEIIGFDTLSGDIQNEVDQLKLERGYNYWESDDGYILFIASGLKATGGFGIEVLSVEDNEGKTVVSVSETSPDPDAMVTQAIEYPYALIRFEGTTDDFSIMNQDGEAFDRKEVDLSAQETVVGIYVGQIDNNSIEVTVGEDFMVFRNYIMGELISGIESGDAVKVTYQLTEEEQYQLIRIEVLE